MATKKPVKKVEKAKEKSKRVAGDAATKIASKFVQLSGRKSGATMRDFLAAGKDMSENQVRYRVVQLCEDGRIRMEGPRAKTVYRT